jgi:hypothetical protein
VRHPGAVAAVAVAALVVTGCSDPAPNATAPTTPPTVAVSPDGWTERAPAPNPRTEVAAAALGGKIWVLGGMNSTGAAQTEAAIYDPGADRWEPGPALPEGVHHPSAAGDGSRLWVVGGYVWDGAAHRPTAAVRMIDSATGRWRDGPPLPSPRAAGALAWDGRRLVFAGGVGPDGLAGDVFVLEGGGWRRIGALSPAREHLAAASDGAGTTWFLAGRLGGLDTNRAEVDVVTGDQVRSAGAVPTARGGVAGFAAPGYGGCVAGGEEPRGTFDQVECVTADGQAATLPPLHTSRHGLGAVVVDGVVYVVLGGPAPGLTVSATTEALRLPTR